ncbi:MAG: hypothetical protein WBV25_03690 [Methylocella sp.]
MDMRVDAATLMETVAVFEAATDFEDAIDELMCSGFDRADLSVVASDERVEEKLGHKYRTVAELEDDGTVPRSSYVAPESIHEAEGALVGGPFYVGAVAAIAFVLAYGGSLAAEIDGALLAGAAGGLIGFLFAKSIGNRHLRQQREQMARGGLLLWVRTPDVPRMKSAVEILFNHSGRDVHVHAIPAAA